MSKPFGEVEGREHLAVGWQSAQGILFTPSAPPSLYHSMALGHLLFVPLAPQDDGFMRWVGTFPPCASRAGLSNFPL